MNCGLCKLPIRGDERYTTDHYKCGADLAQSFRDDIAKAEAQRDELLTGLKALLHDINTGVLVRDITRDGEPGWAMHMLQFVQRLQAAQAAIAKAEQR